MAGFEPATSCSQSLREKHELIEQQIGVQKVLTVKLLPAMIKLPLVCRSKSNQIYVTFYHRGKRYRLFNESKFSIPIYPNSYPAKDRYVMGQLLAGEIYKKLLFGQGPSLNEAQSRPNESDLFYLKAALDKKLNESHSKHNKRALVYTFNKLTRNLTGQEISKRRSKGDCSFGTWRLKRKPVAERSNFIAP